MKLWPSFPVLMLLSSLVFYTGQEMLHRSGENRHPCLVPYIKGKAFNSLPLNLWFSWRFSRYGYGFIFYLPCLEFIGLLKTVAWYLLLVLEGIQPNPFKYCFCSIFSFIYEIPIKPMFSPALIAAGMEMFSICAGVIGHLCCTLVL